MNTPLAITTEDLEAGAADFARLSDEVAEAIAELEGAWNELDGGWQSYARSDMEGYYRDTMTELAAMQAMLRQMGTALTQTVHIIDAADREAATYFAWDGSADVDTADSGQPHDSNGHRDKSKDGKDGGGKGRGIPKMEWPPKKPPKDPCALDNPKRWLQCPDGVPLANDQQPQFPIESPDGNSTLHMGPDGSLIVTNRASGKQEKVTVPNGLNPAALFAALMAALLAALKATGASLTSAASAVQHWLNSLMNKGSFDTAKKDINDVNQTAKRWGMDKEQRRDFGDFIEDAKKSEDTGSGEHLGWKWLQQKAREFLGLPDTAEPNDDGSDGSQ